MKTISLTAISITAALIAAVSPSPAHAQQNRLAPATCYVPGSGTIYVIKQSDTPASCKTGHVEFTLAPALSPLMAMTGNNQLQTNAQGAFDLSNDNGLVALGTWGTGNIPATGGGTRLMWYPRKAAFRAGIVVGNQWEDVNIGSGSVAFGQSTTASGQNAFAAGINTIASGNAAIAMGDQAGAIGANSAAFGYKAKAAWLNSIALGKLTVAQAENAVAIGVGAEAWGDHAVAIRGKATGVQSVAIGDLTIASGGGAVALGYSAVANGLGSMALGHYASTNGKTGAFVYGDYSAGAIAVKAAADNQFVVRAQKVWLGQTNAVTAAVNRFIETSTGAYLSTGGAWVSSSDSTKKHRWADVDHEDILNRLVAMPVRSWSYRDETDSVRHLGPTAQEFRAAFGLGDTDKAIATVDADGISLAGIKALARRTADLRRENDELRALLSDVLRRLTALETGRR
jgi:hypothetical protein